MSFKYDVTSTVKSIFASNWSETTGRVVPEPRNIGLGNEATFLQDAVVFYADLDGSTNMVDKYKWEFCAEIYKTFLHTAAKIVRSENGDITAYDGDRIMAIFIGEAKYDRAVRAAMKLRWAVVNILEPQLKVVYKQDISIKHTVGIDAGPLRAVRTGVRGDNDLVWVGSAANYAAKLNSLSSDYPTWITASVYKGLSSSLTYSNFLHMWEARQWTAMNNMVIYRSTWSWRID